MKNMKLADVILLSLSVAFLFVSGWEIHYYGFQAAYWSIMLSIVFFFWYGYRKER